MVYSRRNGWDTAARAFARGRGYCQQHAFALRQLLRALGIRATPVYARCCRLPPKQIDESWEPEQGSSHTWLQVKIDGETKDVCPAIAGTCPATCTSRS